MASAATLAPTAPVAAGPASAAGWASVSVPVAVDGRAAAVTYTSADVGFAEGHGVVDGDLGRRLDGMVAYLPGRSPMVRVDLNWWYVQECRTCALRWDKLDTLVDAATARGIRVLVVLAYAPPWANGGHADDKWFPTSDADWTAIVDRTVERYAGRVFAYEVWNEPNNAATSTHSGYGNYDGDARLRYWQLAKLAYQRIHAACESCVVLAGASGNGTPNTETSNPRESGAWLDWAYANGYGGYFDAVTHHPYPAWSVGFGPARPECRTRWWNQFGPPGESPACGELAYVRSIMVKWGDGAKKIWGTEWGYPTAGTTVIPRATLRDHVVQGVHLWRSLTYTGPLFLFSYRDACTDSADPECNFGVVNRDFTEKDILFPDLRDALSEQWRPVLESGQTMRRWANLLSEVVTGYPHRYQLSLQDDGNLVMYQQHGAAYWATGTRDGVALVNQPDGNVVLRRADGTVVWPTGTGGSGPARLIMQHDGNLVLYRVSDAKVIWASNTVRAR
ncbi:hypothetical protein Pen02_48810 [Plantactinospora endophytica]|uniref:Bulb-type lectin domain-containing protein n=1 Tax=Plantactinospora endophytica TaxID=673535 RepID=A0ABQ4E5H7_9ACTN|nr:hypothetical protein Pen02_48810 [Plantactinospora endophytica]